MREEKAVELEDSDVELDHKVGTKRGYCQGNKNVKTKKKRKHSEFPFLRLRDPIRNSKTVRRIQQYITILNNMYN